MYDSLSNQTSFSLPDLSQSPLNTSFHGAPETVVIKVDRESGLMQIASPEQFFALGNPDTKIELRNEKIGPPKPEAGLFFAISRADTAEPALSSLSVSSPPALTGPGAFSIAVLLALAIYRRTHEFLERHAPQIHINWGWKDSFKLRMG
jgi:hypothetical protein